LNHSRTPRYPTAASEKVPNIHPRKSTHPPGTRDACPTKETVATAPDLWGSRLGCRAGRRQNQPVVRRPADNPFASHRVERLVYRNNGLGLAGLCRRLEVIGGRAAIVGRKGSGKTTLLEELASALSGEPVRVRITGACRQPWRAARAQLPRLVRPNHVVLVDGAEQIGTLGWHLLLRAVRRARCLVVTLHRPGRLPTLIECRPDRGLLCDLVEELAPSDAPTLAPRLADLFERHDGNIRSCFRELYDVYAGRATLSS